MKNALSQPPILPVLSIFSAAVFLGSIAVSRAQLIAYDGFDYPAGTVPTGSSTTSPLNGGSGWLSGNGWFQNGSGTGVTTNVTSSGLSYSDLTVAGNAFQLAGRTSGGSTSAAVFRPLASPIDLTTTSLWLSFIGVDNNDVPRAFGLSLFSGTSSGSSELLGIGHPTISAAPYDWGLSTAGSASTFVDAGTLGTVQSLLLVHITAGATPHGRSVDQSKH